MNRSNYKVLVESKKQAKAFKKVLEVLGERADSEYFTGEQEYPLELLFAKPFGTWALGISNRLEAKEITFKELLTLLVTQVEVEQPKSGLLDGKCAIQVNNEREFKLLMEHYTEKGWKSYGNTLSSEFPYNRVCNVVTYGNKFFYNNEYNFSGSAYTIIPFSDFAAEVGIKIPVFVMRSQDGVDLYEGDVYRLARLILGKWGLVENKFRMSSGSINADWINYLAFSTREAAESWIAEQNKPKSIDVYRKSTLIGKVDINGFKPDGIMLGGLYSEEIADIYNKSISFHS